MPSSNNLKTDIICEGCKKLFLEGFPVPDCLILSDGNKCCLHSGLKLFDYCDNCKEYEERAADSLMEKYYGID